MSMDPIAHMNPFLQMVITVISSVLASSGLWAYALRTLEKKDCKSDMLLGLGHDRIIYLGMHYIERGCITQEEYENLYEYLYIPYEKMGGNGSAKRIMTEVNNLPIVKYTPGQGGIKCENASNCRMVGGSLNPSN